MVLVIDGYCLALPRPVPSCMAFPVRKSRVEGGEEEREANSYAGAVPAALHKFLHLTQVNEVLFISAFLSIN